MNLSTHAVYSKGEARAYQFCRTILETSSYMPSFGKTLMFRNKYCNELYQKRDLFILIIKCIKLLIDRKTRPKMTILVFVKIMALGLLE
jgi:hypothetical protein